MSIYGGAPPGSAHPEEVLGARTLLLRGISSELSESGRECLLKDFCAQGAAVRWIGTSECMMAFPSEKQLNAALKESSSSRACHVIRLSDLEHGVHLASYFKVATEMHEDIKPDHDSRAAKRMIGAALGIKIPAKTPAVHSTSPSLQKIEKHKPVIDAWDD